MNEYSYFLESNFVQVNRLFILVYSNVDNNAKRYNLCRGILHEKVLLRIITSLSMKRSFMTNADTKEIDQIKFVAQLDYNDNDTDLANDQYVCFKIFRKNQNQLKWNEVNIFSRTCNGLIKMAYYEEARFKLTNTILNKLKSAAKKTRQEKNLE